MRYIVSLATDPADASRDSRIMSDVIAARSGDPAANRLTLALPASVRRRGRTHLHRIRRVRAIAEEWDLDVALDLVGANDREWEAEAAVVLLATRLTYVRVRVPVAHVDRQTEAALVLRTLRALADTEFVGTIALAPWLPIWHRWSGNVFTERAYQARADVIDLFRGRPLSSPPSRYEEESNRM